MHQEHSVHHACSCSRADADGSTAGTEGECKATKDAPTHGKIHQWNLRSGGIRHMADQAAEHV